MTGRAGTSADAERERAVGRGVGDGGEQQRGQVRGLRAHRRGASSEIEQRIGERACDADDAEPHQLTDHAVRHARHQRLAAEAAPAVRGSASAPVASARPTRQQPLRSLIAVRTMSTRESGSSIQSTGTSWIRRPARSAITSSSVSKNQPVSATSGQQLARDVGAHRLEAALRIGEAGTEHAAQHQVVTARDEFALRSAHHPRRRRQPGADRDVGVAGDQRRHQWHQRRQVGRQVDVHVGDHVGRRGHPRGVQRTAAALAVEVNDVDVGQFLGERLRHRAACCRCWRCRRS